MKKWAFLIFCFLVLFVLPLAAQGTGGFKLDDSIIAQVLAILAGGGFGGFLLKQIVDWLKGRLKISGGWQAIILAFLASAAATAGVLVAAHIFSVASFLAYTVWVFVNASGFFQKDKAKAA